VKQHISSKSTVDILVSSDAVLIGI